jgi:glycosyltransferase involved in cell wall biosynthesis
MADVARCLLVIPSFRDADRLGKFLPGLLQVLPPEFLIRVVDDGSGPDGAAALKRVVMGCQSLPGAGDRLLEPLLLPRNQGKGAAIYAGWRAGPGVETVGFVDADGAVSAAELRRMWEAWPEIGSDAIVGSRVKMLGRHVERIALRHYTGRVFATLASAITGIPVYDSQCGCKLLKRAAFESAANRGLRASRFAFDVELLVALMQSGCRIVEFPLDWREVAGGKVHVLRDGTSMIFELMQIRRRLGRVRE